MPPAGTTEGSERPCGTGRVGTTLALESRQAHLAGEVEASLIIHLNDVKGAQLKSEIWTLVKSNKPRMRGGNTQSNRQLPELKNIPRL